MYVLYASSLAGWSLHVEADTARALAEVEAALARFPWAELPIDSRPSDELTALLAAAGETDRARALLEEHEREPWRPSPTAPTTPDAERDPHHLERGEIAFAQGDYEEAISQFRLADVEWLQSCRICALPGLARSYDRTGQADSAIVTYERYVATPYEDRLRRSDQYYLAPAHERLGQLYDERGDVENALRNYAKFVELWEDADPELQPRVQAAQARLEEILARRG